MNASHLNQQYINTLVQYYEEEVSGEAYFLELAKHFDQKLQLQLLAKVEKHAAEIMTPLLEKYSAKPRAKNILAQEGKADVAKYVGMKWSEFIRHMVDFYPSYLDDFTALENMAPNEDVSILKRLTEHEIATIDFAKRESFGSPDSCEPLRRYLSQ